METFSACSTHSLFLSNDHVVYGSGLENEHFETTNVPTKMPFPVDMRSVHAGKSCSICLDFDGNAWALGSSAQGQLGMKERAEKPTKLENLPPIQSVAFGGMYFSLFLDVNGNVWSTGSNVYGQLGNGDTTMRLSPSRIENIPKMTAISAGRYHSILLSETGEVWGCGYNDSWQVLTLPAQKILKPVRTDISVPITEVNCGNEHTLFLDVDGNVWGCGKNNYGQLGIGERTDRPYGVHKIEQLSEIVQVAGSQIGSSFLDKGGNVWTCGCTSSFQASSNLPVKCLELTDIISMSTSSHFLFMDVNGSIWGTGENMRGQLGLGDYKDRKTLQKIESLPLIKPPRSFTPLKSARK